MQEILFELHLRCNSTDNIPHDGRWHAAKTQRLVSSTVALRRCRGMAATHLSGLLWDEHHSAAGVLLRRPDILDLAQGLPLGLQMQLAAGDHFE